jgi:hypothetical protein
LRFGRGAETRGKPFRDEGVETGEHYFDFKPNVLDTRFV